MPTLRIEFIKGSELQSGVPGIADARVRKESEIAIGASATVVGSQPDAPADCSHAVLFAVGGACYVDWDGQKGLTSGNPTPADPTTGKRIYVPAGGMRTVTSFKTGAKFSCVQAALS
jgi:hypothetical protein